MEIQTLIGFLIGFTTGIITCQMFNKLNYKTDMIISLLVIVIWIGFHSVAFFMEDLDVAWVFDIIGAGAAGHIIGLDTIKLFNFKK